MATSAPVIGDSILVALDSGPGAGAVLAAGERVALARGTGAHVVHVRETRVVADDVADLEDRRTAQAIVDAAVTQLNEAGIERASGELVHVVGHHADGAGAVLEVTDRVGAAAETCSESLPATYGAIAPPVKRTKL